MLFSLDQVVELELLVGFLALTSVWLSRLYKLNEHGLNQHLIRDGTFESKMQHILEWTLSTPEHHRRNLSIEL